VLGVEIVSRRTLADEAKRLETLSPAETRWKEALEVFVGPRTYASWKDLYDALVVRTAEYAERHNQVCTTWKMSFAFVYPTSDDAKVVLDADTFKRDLAPALILAFPVFFASSSLCSSFSSSTDATCRFVVLPVTV